MDQFNTFYCRGTQAGMKFLTPFMPYRKPKVFYHVKAIRQIVEREHTGHVLIVTGPTISILGLLAPMKKALDKAHVKYTVYDQTSANPTVKNAKEAYLLYRQEHCDMIIGFGGGSNIDCAKAVGVLVATSGQDFGQMKGLMKIARKLPPLVAVPTTAGSGSEVTPALVLSDPASKSKFPIEDYALVPKYAILDPSTNVSLPPSATAVSGMDALTHAVEAYIGNLTTYGTRQDCLMAVRLIYENIDKVYNNGSDLSARMNMLHASYYAGCAISRSLVGYIHAVAHTLGGEYNLSHGKLNAIMLPFVLETYGEKIHPKLHELAVAAGVASTSDSHKDGARKFIQSLKDMKKRFDIGDCIPEIKEEDIPRLAALAAKEANPLYPVPILMNAKELERYYYQFLPVELPSDTN